MHKQINNAVRSDIGKWETNVEDLQKALVHTRTRGRSLTPSSDTEESQDITKQKLTSDTTEQKLTSDTTEQKSTSVVTEQKLTSFMTEVLLGNTGPGARASHNSTRTSKWTKITTKKISVLASICAAIILLIAQDVGWITIKEIA
jgi:hypothetical protein